MTTGMNSIECQSASVVSISTYHILPKAVEECAHVKVVESLHIGSGTRIIREEGVILPIL